ncbi:MAG: hypothetical protein HOG19_09585 [Gammaproteobacteria bacterium]|jgi:hypothetical protein|nr:hypothetical protein [Gammaproteobacteria bacterium]
MHNSETKNTGYWMTELLKIRSDLDQKVYKPGPWHKLTKQLAMAPAAQRREVSDLVSEVSDLLHSRKHFPKAPFLAGYFAEWVLFTFSVALMQADQILVRLAAVGLLALCLQPLIKVTTGLLLGVRYAYVYLWYVEPRFKMTFGTYLAQGRTRQCALHLAGSVGTPIALLVGIFLLDDNFWLQSLCFAGFFGALILQVGAFILVMAGVRKVGTLPLTTLTTPAMLAEVYRSSKSF